MIEEIKKESITGLLSFFHDNNIPVVDDVELGNNPFLHIFIYKIDNKIIGYLNYSIMYDKAELNYIFVDLKYRKTGIGSILMDYLFKKCEKCQNITLEVRKDNISAINLYKKYDFKECAIRKNYYDGMDGILMMYERGE